MSPRAAPCRPLVVDHYDSYTGSLVDLVARAAGTEPVVVQHDRADLEDLLTAGYTHVVLSPGPGHPDDPRDFRIGKQMIARAEVPVLGVCLGHQGIVSAFGGAVSRVAPAHGVVSRVHHDASTLFRGLPSPFPAVRYHSLAATALPGCLRATAWSDCGDDTTVMAVQHTSRPVFGVQFHPESVLSEHGALLVRNFLDLPVAPGDDRPEQRRARSVPRRRSGLGTHMPTTTTSSPTVRTLPWVDPDDIFRRVEDRDRVFWLDGEGRSEPGDRFSYIGWLRSEEASLTFDASSGTVREHRGRESRTVGSDIFDVLDSVGGIGGVCRAGAELPFAFTGGWVGYLGYGCRADFAAQRRAAGSALPDACLMRVERFLAFDHAQKVLYAVSSDEDAAEWFGEVAMLLARGPGAGGSPAVGSRRVTVDVDREEYAAAFGRVRRALLDGHSYEVNLTYRVEARARVDPPDLMRRLRSLGPAPYAALVRHRGVDVVSASPERFLAVDADGLLESRPIKGTTPRSPESATDALLAKSLATEPRFVAENLMVTDLVRHDLAGVCERGSVAVPALMRVESYPNVHQLVTTVRGRLRDDVSTVRAIEAVFPPASMTGAPKRRTMELIADVESSPRGIYAGAIGWIAFDGRADLGVVIRSAAVVGDRIQLGTGGAVTVHSDADAEYDETRWKIAHLTGVLLDATEPVDRDRSAEPVSSTARPMVVR